jgi:WXG100 family type VII secretion target
MIASRGVGAGGRGRNRPTFPAALPPAITFIWRAPIAGARETDGKERVMSTGDQLHGMTETLQQAAAMAGNVAKNIEGHRVSLWPIVDSLKGQWEGTARPAFDAAHAQWDAGVVRLNAALEQLGEGTAFSSNVYLAADEAGSSAMNTAHGMAPFGGATRA